MRLHWRHPGTALAFLDQPVDELVAWMARHLDIPAAAFAEYARRPQTMTDHSHQLAATLGLRVPTMADGAAVIERIAIAGRAWARILADATNLGLGRMAAASHGVTRDKLVWTADAFIRSDTYKAALARIIDAHHALPIASSWGDGTTSSSDRQFFRAATLPARSTHATATIPASASTPTCPTSTGPTACASCRPPATRPHTCWTD